MKPRILFVDDEPKLLKSVERMLHQQSREWDVVFYSDPLAAWERIQQGGIDAVVSFRQGCVN